MLWFLLYKAGFGDSKTLQRYNKGPKIANHN
jgi:hypothetical protein